MERDARAELGHTEQRLNFLRLNVEQMAGSDASVGPYPGSQQDATARLALTEQELVRQLEGLRQLQSQLEAAVLQLEAQPGSQCTADEDSEAGPGAAVQRRSEPAAAQAAERSLLRRQLDNLEERHAALQRDYEVELLLRQASERQARAHPPQTTTDSGLAPATDADDTASDRYVSAEHSRMQVEAQAASLDAQVALEPPGGQVAATASTGTSSAGAALERPEGTVDRLDAALERHPRAAQQLQQECRQLRQRAEERERQVAKLRASVRHLQAQLADASSSQSQGGKSGGAQHQARATRRLAELEDQNAELADKLADALADAEAARHEAAAQRRLVKRLQRRPPSASAEPPAAAAVQTIDHLTKRVKVLEAQNMKLRLEAGRHRRRRSGSSAGPEAPSSEDSREALVLPRPSASAFTPKESESTAAAAPRWPPSAGENVLPNTAAAEGATCTAAEAGPGAAVATWEADKRLQRKAEALQAKLQAKGAALAAANAAGSRLKEQLQRAEAELAHSQSAVKELRVQLQRAEARAGPGAVVPAGHAKALLDELNALQQRHDGLERQLAASALRRPVTVALTASSTAQWHPEQPHSFSAPVSPAPQCAGNAADAPPKMYLPERYTDGGTASAMGPKGAAPGADAQLLVQRDLRILDLELERDQAAAQAARLQQRLDSLFTGPEHNNPGSGGGKGVAGRPGKSSARERELLDTVALLRTALERTKKGLESGVSNSRYMQVVDRLKQLRARHSELERRVKEAQPLQEQLRAAQREAAQAHVLISALRGQLRSAKQGRAAGERAREELMNAQVAELERALQERDVQLAALRHSACEEARALLAEGLTPRVLVQQLLATREQLREAEQRGAALAAELAPFDAAFFSELRQLKFEHEELRQRCARHEAAASAAAN